MSSFKHIFLILILSLYSINSFSCSCDDMGGFAYSSQYSDAIGVFEFLENDSIGIYGDIDAPFSKKVKLIKQIRGRNILDTITVFGDYGADCRPYISTFKNGEKWLLALNKLDTISNSYEISSCGTFYLKIQQKQIIGNILGKPYNPSKDSLNLNQLISIINSPEKFPIDNYQNKVAELGLYLNCECSPICPIDSQSELWIQLKQHIELPDNYMNSGDSFIIHLKFLIYHDYHYLSFHGIEQNQDLNDPNLTLIETQIENWLNSLKNFNRGDANYYNVASEVLLPLIIKK